MRTEEGGYVQRLAALAQRWRYLVIAIEVMVAVACVYFGFSAVGPPTARAPVQVHRAPTRPPEFGAAVGLPGRLPGGKGVRPVRPPGSGLGPSADVLSRINHDDFELYRRQWQVLQMLMAGVRTYLEQRVVPRLLSR